MNHFFPTSSRTTIKAPNLSALSLDGLINKLKFGSSDKQVARLQSELKRLKFFPTKYKITNYYGKVTQAAVVEYLKSKNN